MPQERAIIGRNVSARCHIVLTVCANKSSSTLFNPAIPHQFEHGEGLTIVFVKPCAASSWAPLGRLDPRREEVLRRMADDGIIWNSM